MAGVYCCKDSLVDTPYRDVPLKTWALAMLNHARGQKILSLLRGALGALPCLARPAKTPSFVISSPYQRLELEPLMIPAKISYMALSCLPGNEKRLLPSHDVVDAWERQQAFPNCVKFVYIGFTLLWQGACFARDECAHSR